MKGGNRVELMLYTVLIFLSGVVVVVLVFLGAVVWSLATMAALASDERTSTIQ